ncbi:TPA: heme lyase [Clostridium perfringens]|nr:heme lyase [Clostridium perfringens]
MNEQVLRLILMICICITFLAFEEMNFYDYLSRNIDEKKFNKIMSISVIITFISSLYSIWTLNYIFIYIFELIMLKTLIILLIKKELKRAIYFSVRNAIYVLILYEIYITKYL